MVSWSTSRRARERGKSTNRLRRSCDVAG